MQPAGSNDALPVANLNYGEVHTLGDGSKLLRMGDLDVWVTK